MTAFDIYLLYKDLFNNIESLAQAVDRQELEDLQSFAVYTTRQFEMGIVNYEDLAL